MAIKSIVFEIQASKLRIKVFRNQKLRADHSKTMECHRDTRGPLRGYSYPLALEGPQNCQWATKPRFFWMEAFNSASKILTHRQYN